MPHLRFLQPGGPGPRIYIHQEQGGLVIPPGTGFFFIRLLRLAGLRWRYSNPPPHGANSMLKLKLKLIYGRRSVGQFFLVSGSHLELMTRFLVFCLTIGGILMWGAPLTRGRVCSLLLLLGLSNTVPLGSESKGIQDPILLSQFLRFLRTGGPGPRIYIPQERGGPVIPPGTGFLLRGL
jgi:hypothetical protein